MKRLKQLVSAAILSILASTAVAQTVETTPNLVNNNNWSGIGARAPDPNDCCGNPAGSLPLYDTATNIIKWSYSLATVEQGWAINQALQGTGIQVSGYNYSYDIRNLNGSGGQNGTDSLTVNTWLKNSAGQVILSSSHAYNTQFDWTTFSGTRTLGTPMAVTDLGTGGISFRGADGGFWAGLYGPEVRNVSYTVNYAVDPCAADPQSSPSCPGYKTYYNMTDDGYAQVNLPFSFPFYGQTFTTSYMFTNGVVGFLNTNLHGYCCDGVDLNQQRFAGSTSWNFAIYALNTDLYPGQQSTFYTQTTNSGQGIKYTWDRVVELGTNNENTFSVELRNTGYIGINYQQVNLSPGRSPLIGIAGNISQGQYSQYYYGPAYNLPNIGSTTLQYSGIETTDACAINPLIHQSCPDYATAYFNQQCSINALYDTACPGHAAAYLAYRCNIDQLYSSSCPGYAEAYLNQQCGINSLFASSCQGYQTALDQCSIDPLSNTRCPGYNVAVNECSTNGLLHTYCPTYQTELNYCSTDPLFNNLCSGYTAASNACSNNQLTYTYCPSYNTTLAACSTNPQSNTMCPGYSSTASSSTGSSPILIAASSVSDPVASAAPLVSDPVVNQSITSTATSASPAQAATATVPLVAKPEPAATTSTAVATASEEKTEEKTEDTKSADSSSSTSTASTGEQKKDQPKTMRQQIQEQRVAAARAKAVEAGKELANKMGEAASMEAQVAVQNVVIQAMGFTPGFDTYNRAMLPDAQGYRPFEIYPGQRVIDNPQGRRFMTGSDRLHAEMVDQQYSKEK